MIEADVRKFLSFLPELEMHEVYLAMLSVRSRYAKEMLGIKLTDTILTREVIRRVEDEPFIDVALRKIRRLEVMAEHAPELYWVKGHPVPVETTGIMLLMNPRHVLRAGVDLIKEVATRLYEVGVSECPSSSLRELSKLHVRWTACLHRRPARKMFFTFDVDVKDKSLLSEVLSHVQNLPHMVIETVRGFHVVVRAEKKEQRAMIYKDVVMNPEVRKRWGDTVEFKPDPMEPVPGTRYATKVVRIIHLEE